MTRSWFDPRVPDADRCVLRPLLDRHAAATPDKVFARFADGSEWTYRQTQAIARRTAIGLAALGVQQGDHVLSWLPNGPDAIRIWFGLNYLGAVYVPINLAYRGGLLAHVVANSDAQLIVAHADLVGRLADIDRAALTTAVVLNGVAPGDSRASRCMRATALEPADGELPPLAREIAPWDTQTHHLHLGHDRSVEGRAVVVPASLHDGHRVVPRPRRRRPLHGQPAAVPCRRHGRPVYAMLALGGSIAIVEAFDTASFWRVVTETGTTACVLLGVMAHVPGQAAARPAGSQPHAASAIMVPLCEDAAAFSARFGCDVYTVFNMTEVSTPIRSGSNPSPLGTCGRPRPGVEARVVDENDCEVAPGEVGELIVRTDRPWAMNHGYYKNPEATAKAWRNGWFHTGDAFRVDEDGQFFFVDRMKDAIRRRGENISSFEVETEVCAHPAVKEAAAVAVPSEFAEDEVLVAVSLVEGASLDPAELIAFLTPRMAHFMVPRYVRIVPDLPKTPTQKVQKHLLRSEGITADTWDREKAGIRLKRQRLSA